MKLRHVCASVLALAVAAASPAVAGPQQGIEALKQWNLITVGDVQSSSNIEGRAFIGGNLTGSSLDAFKNGNELAPSSTPGLVVVGDVTTGSNQILNGGGAQIGGNVTGGLNLNGDGQVVTIGGKAQNINGSNNSSITIGGTTSGYLNGNGATVLKEQNLNPAFQDSLASQRDTMVMDLRQLSDHLSGLNATDSITYNDSRATFNADASNGTSLAVFNLELSDFNNIGEIQFNRNGFDTIVVNVSGTDGTFRANFLGGTQELGENVIWNFYEAESLTFNTGFGGSVLALGADATIWNPIEGSVAFGSLKMNSEVHLNNYNGSYEIGAVPEPATWAQLIAGFGLVGAAMRVRRRRAVAA